MLGAFPFTTPYKNGGLYENQAKLIQPDNASLSNIQREIC